MRKECEQHYTPARDNQYRATARYYVDSCPYCKIEQLQSHLRLLAEAVLEAHFQIATSHKCQCPACKVAREVLNVSSD